MTNKHDPERTVEKLVYLRSLLKYEISLKFLAMFNWLKNKQNFFFSDVCYFQGDQKKLVVKNL